MDKKKIWIISEVFYPDETSTAYIMTNIAEALSEDAEVHVLCGPLGYGELQSSSKGLPGITFHRLNAFNFDKNNIINRLLRLLFLSMGMFFYGLFKINKKDSVFLVTNPALSIPLFSLLKKVKKFNYSILVHDVFPENLIPANIIRSKSNLIYMGLKSVFNWSYRKADKLIVLGRDMADIMSGKTKNKTEISIIENWADLENIQVSTFEENDLIEELGLRDKIVFLFAGNLGRLQGLSYLMELIKEVDNNLLHFVFVGNGALLEKLNDFAKTEELNNVTFLGSLPRSKQNVFLNACHFGIVTLEQEVYGLGVPSKTYNILASGRPVFFIGNKKSEVAQMINEFKCGVCFDKDERAETINFLNTLNERNLQVFRLMGLQARSVAEGNYAKEAILNKFKKIMLNEV